MPFGKYKDMKHCVSMNQDKEKPEAYCAAMMKKVEGEQVKRDEKGRIIVAENVKITFDGVITEKVEVTDGSKD